MRLIEVMLRFHVSVKLNQKLNLGSIHKADKLNKMRTSHTQSGNFADSFWEEEDCIWLAELAWAANISCICLDFQRVVGLSST